MTVNIISQTALRAGGFDQSIGANTHLTATSSDYGDIGQVISDLEYLNITQVRNRVADLSQLSPYISLGKAGIKFDLIVQSTPAAAMAALDVMAPYTEFVEGRNEVNNSPITYVDAAGVTLTGPAADLASQADLFALVKSDPLLNGNGKSTPVLNFSLAPGG